MKATPTKAQTPTEKKRKRSAIFFEPLPLTALRPIVPRTIMAAPSRLRSALAAYFNTQIGPTTPPTFEGLALCAGFNSFAQLRSTVVDEVHPQESRDLLVIACARIADHYQQNGLLETLNPQFVKYLLSAYLNISEKHEHLKSETSDKTITVRWVEDRPTDLASQQSKESIRAASANPTTIADELAELAIEDIL